MHVVLLAGTHWHHCSNGMCCAVEDDPAVKVQFLSAALLYAAFMLPVSGAAYADGAQITIE